MKIKLQSILLFGLCLMPIVTRREKTFTGSWYQSRHIMSTIVSSLGYGCHFREIIHPPERLLVKSTPRNAHLKCLPAREFHSFLQRIVVAYSQESTAAAAGGVCSLDASPKPLNSLALTSPAIKPVISSPAILLLSLNTFSNC